MAWVYLIAAGVFEMLWPFGLKYTNGFTRHWWAMVATALMLVTSFGLMTLASKTLPMGTVYAVWTGMGAVGIAAIGMIFLNEPRDLARIICIGLIVVGLVGLRFWTTEAREPAQQAAVEGATR